jgi:hypothetical protein
MLNYQTNVRDGALVRLNPPLRLEPSPRPASPGRCPARFQALAAPRVHANPSPRPPVWFHARRPPAAGLHSVPQAPFPVSLCGLPVRVPPVPSPSRPALDWFRATQSRSRQGPGPFQTGPGWIPAVPVSFRTAHPDPSRPVSFRTAHPIRAVPVSFRTAHPIRAVPIYFRTAHPDFMPCPRVFRSPFSSSGSSPQIRVPSPDPDSACPAIHERHNVTFTRL